jgi:hypothetical protein
MTITNFCIVFNINDIIEKVVNSHEQSTHGLQDSIELIFKVLDFEVALNYEDCIR